MKLTAVTTALVASAALVSASPLRVIVVSNAIQQPDPFANMRFGHAAAVANPNLAQVIRVQHGGAPDAHHRRPCGGRGAGWRQKSIEIANSFRKTFGLPLIETKHGHGHHKMIELTPIPGFDRPKVPIGEAPGENIWQQYTDKDGNLTQMKSMESKFEEGSVQTHPSHHFHHFHNGAPRDTFFMRLQLAIMSLGPWEGRAVAFVIGAGIGVLLRMFWVLSIVAFRGFSGGNEYAAVQDDEDDDEEETPRRGTPLSAPPQYVYPIDEKASFNVVAEAPKAATGPN